ncbi:hypothetical protein ASF11_03495 [Acidovorax sp. Leaf76]|nr:hypothetical protein ASF11_03495 [Acidovorax sp. Leaf76]KQO40521.1 hypothetical protein ASF19_02535 [Acidovorax sp. Leaf84]KQS42664.1 hypothetical protein ASG27_02470 [Acidovorax sp. Leaf191]
MAARLRCPRSASASWGRPGRDGSISTATTPGFRPRYSVALSATEPSMTTSSVATGCCRISRMATSVGAAAFRADGLAFWGAVTAGLKASICRRAWLRG